MQIRWLAVALVLAALTIGPLVLVWRQRLLERQIHSQTAEIIALQQQLDSARQDLIAHWEHSRRRVLDTSSRTPDEFLALFPAKFPQGDWQPNQSLEDCWFRSADGLRLHGWLVHHDQPRHVILYVHGNAGNVTHRAALAQFVSERNEALVFVFDYRGYGRSEGTPTIPGLLDDARAARALVAQRGSLRE